MSRCFPFPPPGYLKKDRTDGVDLLRKEKQKEKKHKKEKNKEKRESKERREKEVRDGKHKEKKDKKKKHREKKKDKNKDKNKDRDKNKISSADDKAFQRQAASNLHHEEIKQDDKKDILFENRLTKQQYSGNNGEKASEKNLLDWNTNSRFLSELERRISNDDGRVSNQLDHNLTNANHGKNETTDIAKGGGTRLDGNDKLKDKGFDVKKIDGRGIQAEVRPIGNSPARNYTGMFHSKVDGIPKLLGKYLEKNLEAVEGKEKVREKKDEDRKKTEEGKVKEKNDEGKEKVKKRKDDKRRDKRKDKEKEKKGHGKNKDRDKEKKKEEKAKESSELKTIDQNKLKENNKIGFQHSNCFTQLSTDRHEDAVGNENIKKRKHMESNGVTRVNDSLPNKFSKLSSTHSFTENGRILDPFQNYIPNSSDTPLEATSFFKVEKKEGKKNGIFETQSFSASSNNSHHGAIDFVTEASVKPSHPDSKYLGQVYSVPKVNQWSDFDDQEWLFDRNVLPERKSVMQSSEVGDTPRVWAEALHIQSADVFALPYVIPY